MTRVQIKNEVVKRMQKFNEDSLGAHDRVLIAFMLDTEAEDLYGQAVRVLMPSASRFLVYSNDNAISRFQEKIALDDMSNLAGNA